MSRVARKIFRISEFSIAKCDGKQLSSGLVGDRPGIEIRQFRSGIGYNVPVNLKEQ